MNLHHEVQSERLKAFLSLMPSGVCRAKDRPRLLKCRLTLPLCSMSSCVLVLVWAEMTTEASEGVDGEKERGREGGGGLVEIQSSVLVL